MIEGMVRILSQRLLQTERMAAIVRLAYMSALLLLGMALRRPEAWGILAGLQGLLVLGSLWGYSIYVLVASSRGSFPLWFCHLSVILDAGGAALFLYRFLSLPSSMASQAAVVAGEVYFFVPIVISLLKLRPLNTFVAAVASAVGSSLVVVFFVLLHGRDAGIWHAPFLPWLLLIAGLAFWLMSRSHKKLLAENFVTDHFLRASRRLRMTMEIVQVSIFNLNQLVNNLDKISGGLALGAHAQANSVERITSLAGSMKTAMTAVSDATGRSAATVKKTLGVSSRGQRIVQRLVEEISATIEAARQATEALQLINEIADHTNLLALNASIEASRVGEASAGFSVVAGEIRSLAESAAETANEINRLVSQSSRAIQASGDASREAAGVFDQIWRDLNGFDGFVNELKMAVAAQMGAGNEVSASLEKIRDVTAENSLAAERVKQVVAELKNEVVKLKALLEDKLVEASEQQAPASAKSKAVLL
jgi:hypothetical protein